MPSSVIRKYKYHPERRQLEVIFTTGRRYIYSDVPPKAVEQFDAAFSKGVHFNRYIRDHFPYRELHEI